MCLMLKKLRLLKRKLSRFPAVIRWWLSVITFVSSVAWSAYEWLDLNLLNDSAEAQNFSFETCLDVWIFDCVKVTSLLWTGSCQTRDIVKLKTGFYSVRSKFRSKIPFSGPYSTKIRTNYFSCPIRDSFCKSLALSQRFDFVINQECVNIRHNISILV